MKNTLLQIQQKTLDNINSLVESFQALHTLELTHKPTLSYFDEVDGYHILGEKNDGTPLLIIPSLLNKYHILDMNNECSFIHNLQNEGFKVFLLDWHSSTKTPDSLGKCTDIISRAVTQISCGKKIHLLGHCMGGLLCLPVLNQGNVASFTAIATPVNFTSDKFQLFAQQLQTIGSDNFNGEILRDAFYLAKPFSINKNLRKLLSLPQINKQLSAQIIDWVNNTPDLNSSILAQCAADLINENTFLSNISSDIQSLIIAGKYDSIAPLDSTIDATDILTNSTLKIYNTGHIGLVTQHSCAIAKFIAANLL